METGLNKELEEVLTKADYIGLRKFFKDKTEDECIAVSKTAIAIYKKAVQGSLTFHRSAFNAVLVTADEEQLGKVPFWFIADSDFDFDLIQQHKQKLSQRFVENLVQRGRISLRAVKELAERDLCTTPDSSEFIECLIGSLPRQSPEGPFSLESLTVGDTFYEHYVWRLFEVEGAGENSLAAQDKFRSPDSTWQHYLLEASKNGSLSRDRLLDASLQALGFDFAQFRASWFSRFHEALKPTIDEQVARSGLYGQLMGSAISPTVSFAINALTEINKTEPLDPETLFQCLEPALSAKAKSTVNMALALIDSSIERHRDACAQLSVLATRAFLNGSPEVQTNALRLIAKHNSSIDADLHSELLIYESTLCPSARKMLDKLLGSSNGAAGDINGDGAANEKKPFHFREVYTQIIREPLNPLFTNAKLEPFETVEDLIAGCAYALEQPGAVGEHERAIEGIVRLSATLPPDFVSRTAALKKRAGKFSEAQPWSISSLQQNFALFLYGWLTDHPKISHRNNHRANSGMFVQRRLEKLLERAISKNTLPVLSASTHGRGFIDPDILLQRWCKWDEAGQVPDDEDQAFSLLRLPLSFVDATDDKRFNGEFWRAVRFAVGQSDENAEANTSTLWSAAHAYREPPVVAKAFKINGEPIFVEDYSLYDLRSYVTYFPAVRNLFVASGIRRLGQSIECGYEQYTNCAAFVEPLADSSFVFNRHAYCILAAALIVANPGCSGLARDVLIQMIDAQRLDVDALGQEINTLLFAGNSKVKRLIDSLNEVARVGPLCSNATRQLLERALQGGQVAPKPLSPLLELLNELLHAEGAKLENTATREYLSSIDSGGKTKTLVRQLLS